MIDTAISIDVARIAKELKLRVQQVQNVTRLLDDGNTVPFITRYRKEQTEQLDEEQIRQIESRVRLLRQLAEKAETILRLIDAQGKLTPSLRKQIEQADSIKRLDDLYLPFRPRRKSRAEAARQKGLEPLADAIWNAEGTQLDLSSLISANVSDEQQVESEQEALNGASDILAERVSEDAEVREIARRFAWRSGTLSVSLAKSDKAAVKEYAAWDGYQEAVWKIPAHRVLALNRGEKEGLIRVRFDGNRDMTLTSVLSHYDLKTHPAAEFLESCVGDALDRLIQPSIEREIRRELTEQAEGHAVSVFARNLRCLLLQPCLNGQRVLAIDPGFRTGCKVAVLDEFGQCLHTDVVYVTGSAEKRSGAIQKLASLLDEHRCRIVAIGNGTACRETEELVSELIADHVSDCRYVIINEAGASIYSTSTVAREEFPDADATVRGTISIGRRLQDPLSELVKIEPQHIGVGMYQHDMSPRVLKESLDSVVESCVNYVGVDLNTASASLLRYVSGLNQLIARRVVEWRDSNGQFQNRAQLRDVPGIGESTFTQAAGFLKITDGSEPLDGTWIHPESYALAQKLLDRLGLTASELVGGDSRAEFRDRMTHEAVNELAQELQIGKNALRDLIDALIRPGRDPRSDLPEPVFKHGILKLNDLSVGLELTGTVLNVVDFGAFVDIGLKDSGLVHISAMADRFIASPHDVVSVGDIVTVWVKSVDIDRQRVSLTMLNPQLTAAASV